MKFGSVQSALEKFVEYKLKEFDNTPSAFSDIDKFKTLSKHRWICTSCFTQTDIHTGLCELCEGDLVVYRSIGRASARDEATMSDRLDLVNFVVDFEKILKRFTSHEQNLMLYMGYGGEDTVISYLLDKYNIKSNCENLNHLSEEINKVKVRLEEYLFKADYLRSPSGAVDPKRSKRKSEAIARKLNKLVSQDQG